MPPVPTAMSTAARRFLMGRPPAAMVQHLSAELDWLGLAKQLGAGLFEGSNWHQSLFDCFEDQPQIIRHMLRAGAMFFARAVRFRIDRIKSRIARTVRHFSTSQSKSAPASFDTGALVLNK